MRRLFVACYYTLILYLSFTLRARSNVILCVMHCIQLMISTVYLTLLAISIRIISVLKATYILMLSSSIEIALRINLVINIAIFYCASHSLKLFFHLTSLTLDANTKT